MLLSTEHRIPGKFQKIISPSILIQWVSNLYGWKALDVLFYLKLVSSQFGVYRRVRTVRKYRRRMDFKEILIMFC